MVARLRDKIGCLVEVRIVPSIERKPRSREHAGLMEAVIMLKPNVVAVALLRVGAHSIRQSEGFVLQVLIRVGQKRMTLVLLRHTW